MNLFLLAQINFICIHRDKLKHDKILPFLVRSMNHPSVKGGDFTCSNWQLDSFPAFIIYAEFFIIIEKCY